jgi:hypothetical protein
MDVRFAFLLMFLVMFASTVSAQSPCAECFNAVQEELKACLANAISVDDKKHMRGESRRKDESLQREGLHSGAREQGVTEENSAAGAMRLMRPS